MKLLIFFVYLVFEKVSPIKLRSKYIEKPPYPNINDHKIDISNNNTYVGRILNGSLIIKDYQNISQGFTSLNMNNSFNTTALLADTIDKALTEDDLENHYFSETYSNFGSECNFNKKIVLERHNFLRSKHNASALKWDNFLEQRAKDKAKQLEGEKCPNRRETEKKLGILILNGFGTIYTEEEIINHFYEGAYSWKWKNKRENKFDYNIYDFAQILWKKTEKVGCAKACCLNNQIWICFYNPPALVYDLKEIENNLEGPIKSFEMSFE